MFLRMYNTQQSYIKHSGMLKPRDGLHNVRYLWKFVSFDGIVEIVTCSFYGACAYIRI